VTTKITLQGEKEEEEEEEGEEEEGEEEGKQQKGEVMLFENDLGYGHPHARGV
jgi:hypothetical protein